MKPRSGGSDFSVKPRTRSPGDSRVFPFNPKFVTTSAWKWIRQLPDLALRVYRKIRDTTLKQPLDVIGFVTLFLLALLLRVWDLGSRTLHYDEVLHGYYSWIFSEGAGYVHTPLMHGPLLFHIAAGSFNLAGSSDAILRFGPALAGAILVVLPTFLRKELGQRGTLIAGVLLTFSPSLLYFSRFARNDAYMAVWMLALVIVMWRYIDRPRTPLLFLWVGLWALSFVTKETAYISAVILGAPLFLMSAPDLFRWVKGRMRLSEFSPPAVLLLSLVTITLPLWTPAIGLFQDALGLVLVNGDPNAHDALVVPGVATGFPAGGSKYVAVYAFIVATVLGAAVGLRWNNKVWPFLYLSFFFIWVVFYSSLFQNLEGISTGAWGSLGYWIAQHSVGRADQPIYYYVLILTTYEFLIVACALTGVFLLRRKIHKFDLFLMYWSVSTFLAYSYAGEKMPWLIVGITLPLAILGGKSVAKVLLDRIEFRRLKVSWVIASTFLGGATVFLIVATILLGIGSVEFTSTLGFGMLVSAVAVGVAISILVKEGRKGTQISASFSGRMLSRGEFLGLVAVVILVSTFVFTIFVAARATYYSSVSEEPRELLIYSQGGIKTKRFLEEIDRISVSSGMGKAMPILVGLSDNFSWQWRWYLRDYTNVMYRDLKRESLSERPNVGIVLFSKVVESRNERALGEFSRFGETRHLWWFPNTLYTFKDLNIPQVGRSVISKDWWRSVLDYFFWREFRSEMYRSTGVMYVNNDLMIELSE